MTPDSNPSLDELETLLDEFAEILFNKWLEEKNSQEDDILTGNSYDR
jgi:hypothetical protein